MRNSTIYLHESPQLTQNVVNLSKRQQNSPPSEGRMRDTERERDIQRQRQGQRERDRERWRQRERDRQTDRDRERQRQGQRDRDRQRHRERQRQGQRETETGGERKRDRQTETERKSLTEYLTVFQGRSVIHSTHSISSPDSYTAVHIFRPTPVSRGGGRWGGGVFKSSGFSAGDSTWFLYLRYQCVGGG